MRRREFLGVASGAAAWPVLARRSSGAFEPQRSLSCLWAQLARGPSAPGQSLKTSVIVHHESLEEGRKLPIGIERQDVGNMLVRSHDHHAAPVSIDTAHIENVVAAFQVGAKHLFVIAKPVAPLPGQKKRWHRL